MDQKGIKAGRQLCCQGVILIDEDQPFN